MKLKIKDGKARARILVRRAASEKFLKKLPPNTELHDDLHWSSWDGKLAMVSGPSYYDTNGSGLASSAWFNAAQMARRYAVRYAIDGRGNRMAPPKKGSLGYEIVVRDRSAPYWKTEWTIGGLSPFDPMVYGTFEKKTEDFLVEVKLKDLGIAEVRAVTKLYDSYGYADISDNPKLAVKKGDWKKLLAKKKFSDTQNFDYKLANAAYELLYIGNGYKHPRDEKDEQMIWESIQGVYKTNKKGDKLMFIQPK
jgi:hypothetical protein